MNSRMKIMAVMLAGCMLMSNIQPVYAQEAGDLSGEISVSAEQEEVITEMLPESEQIPAATAEMSGSAESDLEAGNIILPEENTAEELLVPEDAGTDTESADEMQEEDLLLIPDEEEKEPAVIVFGQEYNGYISGDEPLQKYEFTLEHDGSIQIAAQACIACVQYSIFGPDEAVCWTAAPEWDPETESSEITETVGLTAGIYTFTVGQTETYEGEYSFRIETGPAAWEQAGGSAETAEDNAVPEEEFADIDAEENRAEEDPADTAAEDPGRQDGTEEAEDAENAEDETMDAVDDEAAEALADATLLQGGRNMSSAEAISFGTAYTGSVSGDQPIHWYKVTVPNKCNVHLYALAYMDTIYYNVYNESRRLLWYDYVSRDGTSGYSTYKKTFTVEQGTYYFAVEQYSSYTGFFIFSFSIPVTGVKLNKTSQTIAAGKKVTLTPTISPSNASNKNVTWKSSNTAVATVSSKGVVTAKKKGTAVITVTTADQKKTATCKITVTQPVTGVRLNRTKLTLGNGQSVTLKATVSPSNANNKKVTWKSSNTNLATVSSSGKVTTKASANGTVKITATTVDGKKVAACTITVKKPAVSYRTHVQTYGWQGWKKNGAMSGTQGQSKRMEGINIKLSNLPYSGGITYRTHVQTYGWQGWKSNGAMAGTQGQYKRLEAIEIRLTGEMAKYYDVYYRVHAQHFGWMGWAKNGEKSGTAGYSYRLEGIQIVLVNKGGSKPSANLGGQRQWTSTKFSQKTAGSNSSGVWGNFLRNKQYRTAANARKIYPTHYFTKDVTGDSRPELFLGEQTSYGIGIEMIYTMAGSTPKLIEHISNQYGSYMTWSGYSTADRAVVDMMPGLDYLRERFRAFNSDGKEYTYFEVGREFIGYDWTIYYQDASGKYTISESAEQKYLNRIEEPKQSDWRKL